MKRGQQIMSGTEKLQFDHDQFDLYEILPKFHGKALSSSGDIKIFLSREADVHVHSPSFMDEVLREERQLMK